MSKVLLITVRFHDGRYHGTGDWPPSPARLFQALVAGIGQSGPLNEASSSSLEWLECLDAPVIAAPRMVETRAVTNYVPNNDLDAVGGDPRRISSVRTPKPWKAKLFNQKDELLYAWSIDSSDHAERVCSFSQRLYQLGRGVDLAWAIGEVIDLSDLEDRLRMYRGVVFRPITGQGGTVLDCPMKGSLASLKVRYSAMSQRLVPQGEGRSLKLRFTQAPRPRFVSVPYNAPSSQLLLELRSREQQADLVSWPLSQISSLVVTVRDAAVERLKAALPEQVAQIEKCLVGRKANGADDAPQTVRIRIIPLPSIGHQHADHAIRRILIDVPAQCFLRADDVYWAFSGLDVPNVNQAMGCILTPTSDTSMPRHYGLSSRHFVRWRTITAAVLPDVARRRRIEPSRRAEEAKRGHERAGEQQRAAAEVAQALRHAEIAVGLNSIRVQREPFEANGHRAEAFAPGTRFQKERFWHVEVIFTEPPSAPLVIGDGRYYGLGIMAPVQHWDSGLGGSSEG